METFLSFLYTVYSGRMLILSKLYMCCWPVNHSSWGEKSFSKDFILHELNECKRSSCSGLWLIKKKKKRISVMLSARFVQSTRIQKSVPKQPKDLQTAGGPMWCSDVPCFAEIISGALEATGSAKGALGPTQAVRLGHQFSELYGWVCSGGNSCEGVEPGTWQMTALALRVTFGPWIWYA